MNILKIDFENCFGIGKLEHEFKFENFDSNTFLIYAPNGTMKTSFARTFDLVSKNDLKNIPSDRIYTSKVSKYEILVDALPINQQNILVLNAEDNNFDASSKISNFLASKELKKKYDDIYSELNTQKNEYLKKLKVISQSTDCEGELLNTFSQNNAIPFFEVLLTEIENLKDKFEKYNFKYNDVFDKKDNVKKFLDKNKGILEQYITDYKTLLEKSVFFKQTANNSFGTYQATEILKSIEDNSYFDAGHKFVLDDGTEITNSDLLKQLVESEISNIINDDKLKQTFDKIDKAIGANLELRAFKRVIEKDNLILVELKDYEGFQKKIWINYLSEIKKESEILTELYRIKKVELEIIIDEAKKEFALWEKIITTFNSRFYVPFKVILINQGDIILKQETANLEFEYIDTNENPVRQKKENLIPILSKGEQRAYFILQFLFEIESRKTNAEKNIIIFDDIADSFDYKNKFAIIEYIKELHLSNDFRIIVLTHNFDFYRTIASRLSLKRQVVYMTTKSNEKIIKLQNGQYRNDVFVYFIDNYRNPKIFISLIAFVRNIIEYTESTECSDYLKLTSCLHKKNNSTALIVKDIFDIYKTRLIKLSDKTIEFENENLLEFIITIANSICAEVNINEINLENKITLAIATRLKTEEYLIAKLPEVDLDEITSNQTSDLFLKYKIKYPTSSALGILENVNLMTPENIHINAFMYEPLIDMSVFHLKDLYEKVSALN
ncbi:hypothetical protein [Flavobacterium crassostreae]|uniref:Protein CR006 P-loop domain-containing protein n=1 Tax=Flavobacterium crassostreae TaxID=1763534 RepID=A0A1B9E3F7_9FLAO|nr:hypothetical protein [Flavobacterium crassostreae]OCB76466.1 hypothetical protein LPBF_05875 [Flavobacterium crassostreae]